MAAHSAAKAINTQDITDKARRELLHLLETVGLSFIRVNQLSGSSLSRVGSRKEEHCA